MLSSRIVRCLLPAAVLTVAACTVVCALPASEKVEGGGAKAAAPDKGNAGYGKPTEGIRLRLELPDDVIVPMEQPTLAITVKNVSNQTRLFFRTDSAFDFILQIRNPAGKVTRVHRERSFSITRSINQDLQPGQSFTDAYHTRALYVFDKEGTYRITALKQVPKLKGKGFAIVVSNTVDLSVIKDKGQQGSP